MKDFEIGGHRDMSLEEVQEYQEEGGELAEELRDEFPPDEDIHDSLIEDEERLEQEIMDEREPDAELSHQEFIDEQTKFEEELMGEREPGAELSHQEFIDAQDKLEEEIMNSGDSSGDEIIESSEDSGNNVEQEEGFDPEWADPSYEQIVAEPDAAEDELSWATEGIQEAAHATHDEIIHPVAETVELATAGGPDALSEVLPEGTTDAIQGVDIVSETALNEMDAHITEIDDFGTGVAEAMYDMNGGGVTETDAISAQMQEDYNNSAVDISDDSGE